MQTNSSAALIGSTASGFAGSDGWDIVVNNGQTILHQLQSDVASGHHLADMHRHHHQQQQQHRLQHFPVEVKVEAEMMDLLDYNLTALNQSTDSILFDDFAMDIAAAAEAGNDDTDYYDRFVDDHDEEKESTGRKMATDRCNIGGMQTDDDSTAVKSEFATSPEMHNHDCQSPQQVRKSIDEMPSVYSCGIWPLWAIAARFNITIGCGCFMLNWR
jgi:hypothetical protein